MFSKIMTTEAHTVNGWFKVTERFRFLGVVIYRRESLYRA